MSKKHQVSRDRSQPGHASWAETWPKIKMPVQVLLSQLVAWALRRWFG